jgi:hypothetical protein
LHVAKKSRNWQGGVSVEEAAQGSFFNCGILQREGFMSATLQSSNRLVGVLVSLLLFGSSAAQAQFFYDDFEDGSATDGSPVTWVPEVPPWPVGEQRVEAGSLILTPARDEFPNSGFYETDWEVEGDRPADLVLRAQVRALGSTEVAFHSIYARDTTSVDVRQGVYTSALVTTGGYLALIVGENLNNTFLSEGTFPDLTTRTHDVNLELRLLGQDLEVFAWRVGDPRPTTPRLSALSPLENVTMGRVGLAFAHEDDVPTISGAFRFFEVAPIPEPNTLTTATLCLACLGILRRDRS